MHGENKLMSKTVLACCVSGGSYFSASISTESINKRHFGIKKTDEGIRVAETYQVIKSKTVSEGEKFNEQKQIYEYHNQIIDYYDTVNGFIKTFKTVKDAIIFLNNTYNLELKYNPNSKELTGETTIAEKLGQKIDSSKTEIIELELVKYVKENPGKSTKFLQKMFEGGESEDFQYSLLSRLCHDYGKDTSPILIQESGPVVKDPENSYKPIIKNEGWIISPQGEEFLKKCSEQGDNITGDFY